MIRWSHETKDFACFWIKLLIFLVFVYMATYAGVQWFFRSDNTDKGIKSYPAGYDVTGTNVSA